MSNIVIIRDTQDLPIAKQIVSQHPGCRVVCFDPVMVDHAYYDGLTKVEYFFWQDCPSYFDLNREANALALALETELRQLSKAYFPDCDVRGWQHLNLYYLLMSLQWYSGLWQEILPMLRGATVHVIICESPSVYYFNSYIPSALLIHQLSQAGIAHQKYYHGDAKAYPPNKILLFQGVADPVDEEFILAHLPTCVYDLIYFHKELKDANKLIINLKAKHFDLPVYSKYTVNLAELETVLPDFGPDIQQQLKHIYTLLWPAIDQFLTRWLPVAADREAQVTHIAKIYQAQLTNWLLISIYFLKCKPSKIILSDHDADFHGPLVSFAQNYNIPVLLLPHAKTIAQVDFAYDNITALTHPMQGNTILSHTKKAVRHIALAYPEKPYFKELRSSGKIKVGLMLNSISLRGVMYCDYNEYMAGIIKIVKWCEAENLSLSIRGKPSYSIVRLLAKHTSANLTEMINCALGEMESFVETCDLCLMYDTPTSGCIEFLKRGIPIVNPIAHTLSYAESTFTSTALIPRADVDSIVTMLTPIVRNETAFDGFRQQQYQNYLNSFGEAQKLSQFI